MEAVAGAYSAASFTVTEGSTTTDWLDAGATVTMILDAEGDVSGQLFVPGGNDDGSDLVANLAGTWTLDGQIVTFDQAADTFIRDMSFTVTGNALVGDETFGTTHVQLTLTKVPVDKR